jgi:hypothetical protein
MSKKNYFAVLEEIYNNVVPHWSAILTSCNHSITPLISLQKTFQIRDQFFLYMGPVYLTKALDQSGSGPLSDTHQCQFEISGLFMQRMRAACPLHFVFNKFRGKARVTEFFGGKNMNVGHK